MGLPRKDQERLDKFKQAIGDEDQRATEDKAALDRAVQSKTRKEAETTK